MRRHVTADLIHYVVQVLRLYRKNNHIRLLDGRHIVIIWLYPIAFLKFFTAFHNWSGCQQFIGSRDFLAQ